MKIFKRVILLTLAAMLIGGSAKTAQILSTSAAKII